MTIQRYRKWFIGFNLVFALIFAFGLMAVLLAGGCKTPDLPDLPDIPSPQPEPVPTPVPEPVPTPTPEPAEPETATAPAIYGERYDTAGATEIPNHDGGGRFKWNAENSRKKGKVIFPGRYAGKIAWVVCFAPGGFQERMSRAEPNESGSRQRYYSRTGIDSLPPNLVVRAHINEAGVAKDIFVVIPTPQQTYDAMPQILLDERGD
jgi:hypothetical protein